MKTNYGAIVVAGVAGFVFSSLYYSPLLLGNLWQAVDLAVTLAARPSVAKALVEITRTLVITFVLARVIALMGGRDLKSAVELAVWLWLGFSEMMWIGAIMENRGYPLRGLAREDRAYSCHTWGVATVRVGPRQVR